MLELTIKKGFFTHKIIWFSDEDTEPKGCDTCCLIGVPRLRDSRNSHIEYKSLISPLQGTEEDLMSRFESVVRYDIRRSFRDDLTVRQYSGEQLISNKEVLESFGQMYEEMYQKKGLDSSFPFDLVLSYARVNGVMLTEILEGDTVLARHLTIVDQAGHARLWMSASVFRDSEDSGFRARVGRANKRLHYEDMIFLQQKGYLSYDWCGVGSFENPDGIAKFKMSFGGDRITYYDETIVCSFRYRLFCKLRRILRRKQAQ